MESAKYFYNATINNVEHLIIKAVLGTEKTLNDIWQNVKAPKC